jgi:hypothetical protein
MHMIRKSRETEKKKRKKKDSIPSIKYPTYQSLRPTSQSHSLTKNYKK